MRRCSCTFCSAGRWPRAPKKGQRCEGHTGWREDSLGSPVLIGCRADAVETVYVSESMHIEAYVCADHALGGYRNPKRRQPQQPVPTQEVD